MYQSLSYKDIEGRFLQLPVKYSTLTIDLSCTVCELRRRSRKSRIFMPKLYLTPMLSDPQRNFGMPFSSGKNKMVE